MSSLEDRSLDPGGFLSARSADDYSLDEYGGEYDEEGLDLDEEEFEEGEEEEDEEDWADEFQEYEYEEGYDDVATRRRRRTEWE